MWHQSGFWQEAADFLREVLIKEPFTILGAGVEGNEHGIM